MLVLVERTYIDDALITTPGTHWLWSWWPSHNGTQTGPYGVFTVFKNFAADAFRADSELQSVATRDVVFLDQKDLEAFRVCCCLFKESK